ncbi:response regulator [Candidatus Woesearchaeota archaeon]|nr:response regulator [Candidatus Woesearchaeota archaeon]
MADDINPTPIPVVKKRILIAEDESAIRGLYIAILKANYDVQTAPDGKTALEMLADARPDLLITDCVMPHMHGLALIVQAKEHYPDLPCIAASGTWDRDYTRVDAIRAGACAIIQKPFTPSNLLALVEKYLGKPQAQ